MLRSLSARPAKLWSGVTFHFSTPQAGISRSIWSTSSLDEASRMKTRARSATGSPPARIFLSASSFKSASKVGRIPFSKTSTVSSGEANPIQLLNISSSHPRRNRVPRQGHSRVQPTKPHSSVCGLLPLLLPLNDFAMLRAKSAMPAPARPGGAP